MEENAEVTKMIKWINKNSTLWENICYLGSSNLKYKDIIRLLQNLVDNEMYQIAFFILENLMNTRYGEKAAHNLIQKKICDTECKKGVITEYIENLQNIVEENNALDKGIML